MEKHSIKFSLLRTAMTLLFTLLTAATASAATSRLSGYGTKESPYIIQNQDDWDIFRSTSSYYASGIYVKLGADITVSNPIGSYGDSKVAYKGYFDGDGYTITLEGSSFGTSNSPVSSDNAALFAYISAATVKNLRVVGGIYTSKKFACAIAAHSDGTCSITNCISSIEVHSSITGSDLDGTHAGFVAVMESGQLSLTDCVFNGKLLTTKNNTKCGGFVGWRSNGSLFITRGLFNPSEVTIKNTGSSTFCRNCTNSNTTSWSLKNCYYTTKFGENASECKILGTDATGKSNEELLTDLGSGWEEVDGKVVPKLPKHNAAIPSLSGAGTESSPFLIQNADDWALFAKNVNAGTETEAYYQLDADITIDSRQTTDVLTIGTTEHPFKGIFDGNHKKLTVYISETTTQGTAPFREINAATIMDLTVEGDVIGTTHAAGLVGFARGGENTIDSCVVSVNVSNPAAEGNHHIGGVVGHGCGHEEGDNYVQTTLNIRNTIFNGTLSNSGHYAGGLQGWSDGNTLNIENCLSTGTYTGKGLFHPIAIHNTGSTTTATVKTTYHTEPATLKNNQFIAAKATRIYANAKDVPSNKTAKLTKMIDGKDYFVIGTSTITGLGESYFTNGGHPIMINYGVKYNNKEVLDVNTYTAVITDANGKDVTGNVTELGTYTLKVTGDGITFQGTITASFQVIQGFTKGDGTEEKPFEIADLNDWKLFTTAINSGLNASAHYKLAGNLTLGSSEEPLETIVGQNTTFSFKGTFDGGKNTLTVYISRNAEYAAPFGVIDGATIKDLTVKGTVKSTKKYIAGIAAFGNNVTKASNFINCTSSVTLDCQISGDISAGGLLSQNERGTTNFENCVFDGTISGKDEMTEKCGGFINFSGGSGTSINYSNCFMAGTINVNKNIATFQRGIAKTTYTNCYYINNYSGDAPQGIQAESTAPTDKIAKKLVLGENTYYLPGTITTTLPATSYAYTERVINADPTITFGGETLTKDTDYEIAYQKKNDKDEFEAVTEIRAAGEYRIVINAMGNYVGACTTEELSVIAIGPKWSDLQAEFEKGGNICITQDYTATDEDEALNINKAVTLDLNGYTISRGLREAKAEGNVISIASTGNLTIIDSSDKLTGVITGGMNIGNGGGIINNGILTLKSGSISGNACIEGKVGNKNYYGTGGGIYNEGGSKCQFYMEGGNVSNNTAQGGGAGIHGVSTKLFSISGGEIIGNTAVNKGGGVRVKTEATIANCTISGNKTTGNEQGHGGGIYVEAKSVTLNNVTISDNEAAINGGGIYAMSKSAISAANVTITGNNAKEGGCVYLYEATYEMDGGDYHGNTITSKGINFYVSNKSDFALDLEGNATNIVEDLDGCQPSSVTLTGRTLYKDGDWNTLCLPFDVKDGNSEDGITFSGTPLEGAEVRTLESSTFDEEKGALSLTFSEPLTTIVAGTPYLIKWAKADGYVDDNAHNLVNPEFGGVTINTELHPVVSTDGTITFHGTNVYQKFENGNGSILFMGSNNQLVIPGAGAAIGALRAYFEYSKPDLKVKSFVLNFEVGESTGIKSLTPASSRVGEGSIYRLDGTRLNGKITRKGMYIKNGKKVVIK